MISPSGNDTAVIEVPHDYANARKVHDAVSQIEKTNEQNVFINKIVGRNVEIEMAGGEFCGNAARAVMVYLHDKYKWTSATLEYKGYDFSMQGEIVNDNVAQITADVNDLIYSYSPEPKYLNLMKLELSGITHYVVFSDCILYQYRNNFNKTRDLIKNELLTPEDKSVGVMYWNPLAVLAPYVYVRDVDTMFKETACGSGTIATAYTAMKRWETSDEIRILQPSGKELIVTFNKECTKLTLSGVSEIINKGTIQI